MRPHLENELSGDPHSDYTELSPGEQLAQLREWAVNRGWKVRDFDGVSLTGTDPYPGTLKFDPDYAIAHSMHLAEFASDGFFPALFGAGLVETDWGMMERWRYYWHLLAGVAAEEKLAWLFMAVVKQDEIEPPKNMYIGPAISNQVIHQTIAKLFPGETREATAIHTSLWRNQLSVYDARNQTYYLEPQMINILLHSDDVDDLPALLREKTDWTGYSIKGMGNSRLQKLQAALTFILNSEA